MKLKIASTALAIALAGCLTTPEALEASKGTVSQTRTYADNYQALYRKVLGPAQRCFAASNGSTQFQVEAQLYPVLGFGEITDSMSSIYGRNFYIKVKIEKAGSGSKMTVWSGNMLVKRSELETVFSWADGATGC